MDLDIELIPSTDPRLNRHKVHDPRSWDYRSTLAVDTSSWRTINVRIYDPIPNPNQTVGCCTACAQAMLFNTVRNRRTGVVLNMDWALSLYTLETQIDNIPGTFPGQDTGSTGLYAAKASQQRGEGGAYNFIFGGVDQVVQTIQSGRTVAIGSKWTQGMFSPDSNGIIHPTGAVAGGHEYVARGYDVNRDLVKLRCWWGTFRDVWIPRTELGSLLADGGDAHTQDRVLA